MPIEENPGARTPRPAVSYDTAMRNNDSRPDKATERNDLNDTDTREGNIRRTNIQWDGGRPERDLTLETVDGDVAATVTISGTGHEVSPMIVEQIESAIRSELGHLVSDD